MGGGGGVGGRLVFVFLKIFDAQVQPVILYGAEIWVWKVALR